MNNKRLFLSPPHMGVFEQQLHCPLGPQVNAFEKELSEYVGVKVALALSSGTAAIHLALRFVHVAQGDTVFCSSLTFIGSANPILYQGAIPVFIDAEPKSWNMSPAALERAFMDAEKSGRLPKAVIVVNLYGQSADMTPLLAVCDHYGVPVIEDAAESLGAKYYQRSGRDRGHPSSPSATPWQGGHQSSPSATPWQGGRRVGGRRAGI